MAEQTEVGWLTCGQDGCIGIRLGSARECLGHASEEDQAAAMTLVGETGVIDARGVTITNDLLDRILAAVPRGKNEEPLINRCRFDRATFSGFVRFLRATFRGDAWFNQVTFRGGAWFGGATFGGGAWFDEATFLDRAGFSRATFSGYAWFGGATFHDRAGFGQTIFRSDAGFGGAAFHGRAVFDEATFRGRAWFRGVSFGPTRRLGPVLAHRGLVLDDVQFAQTVQIEVSSTALCCRRARFAGGAQFRLRWARVVLDDTDLSAPSILAGIPRLSSEELARQEEQISRAWQRLLPGQIPGRPQLVSLRRADVAGLGLNNISAADCRFTDAHNLDKLRLESGVSFAAAPPLAGSDRGWQWWGGREVIAEERAWRADRPGRRWAAPGWPGWLGDQQPDVPDPGQIAGLYRALRKAREDNKDEPGAADFYYGEMEMRRKATTTPRGERAILWLYWRISGYGLRALRSLAALTILAVVITTALVGWGLAANAPPQHLLGTITSNTSHRARIDATLNTATPLLPSVRSRWTAERAWTALEVNLDSMVFRATDEPLTTAGIWITDAARILGPVLLALTLLAVRNRVKR